MHPLCKHMVNLSPAAACSTGSCYLHISIDLGYLSQSRSFAKIMEYLYSVARVARWMHFQICNLLIMSCIVACMPSTNVYAACTSRTAAACHQSWRIMAVHPCCCIHALLHACNKCAPILRHFAIPHVWNHIFITNVVCAMHTSLRHFLEPLTKSPSPPLRTLPAFSLLSSFPSEQSPPTPRGRPPAPHPARQRTAAHAEASCPP